ncbi:MAG: lanthionine synthetase C family protein [Bacteroidota bacterium]
MGWEVFLSEKCSERAEAKVHEIAEALVGMEVQNGGLMSGAAGLACFYAYYADWTGDLLFDRLVAEVLDQALNPPAGLFPGPKFSDGLAGIAWIIDHLKSKGLLTYDISGIFDQLDPVLYDFMMKEIADGRYDYLHGALGIALYFLRDTENRKYSSYLEELVKELHAHAQADADGSIRWHSVLDADSGLKGTNLSLSHGMASIIIVLSRIRDAGIAQERCESLIEGGLKFMQKQRLAKDKHISIFPSWALENEKEPHYSRLAWCYGDLGIGMAYLRAGQLQSNSGHAMEGMDILIKSSGRKDLQENKVHDAGICHGAAGLALIYNFLYQRSERKVFMEAGLHWLDVLLNMAVHEDGIAGYKAWYHPEYGGWTATGGLLEGASGIGLVLLSFLSDTEPSWGRSLLLE